MRAPARAGAARCRRRCWGPSCAWPRAPPRTAAAPAPSRSAPPPPAGCPPVPHENTQIISVHAQLLYCLLLDARLCARAHPTLVRGSSRAACGYCKCIVSPTPTARLAQRSAGHAGSCLGPLKGLSMAVIATARHRHNRKRKRWRVPQAEGALTCTGLVITYQVRPSVQGGAVKLPCTGTGPTLF